MRQSFLLIRLLFMIYILQFWLISYDVVGANINLIVSQSKILALFSILKTNSFFLLENFLDLTVIDHLFSLNKNYRFRLIYTLQSIFLNFKVNIHIWCKKASICSITSLFPNANWLEREAWDLFGVKFITHPDLRRILTDYQFDGFALRKDFPVIGFIEVFFFDAESRIIYCPVNMIQEYKQFTIETKWN